MHGLRVHVCTGGGVPDGEEFSGALCAGALGRVFGVEGRDRDREYYYFTPVIFCVDCVLFHLRLCPSFGWVCFGT